MSRQRAARPTGIEADFAAFLRMVEAESSSTAAMRATSFVDFVDVVLGPTLGKTLTPGQRAIASVAYDGIDPAALEGPQREMARRIFGPVETVPETCRNVIVVVAGARGGKSFVLCGLRLLHLALTVSLDPLAPGELGVGAIIGPTLDYAQQVLGYVKGAARGCPAIARLIVAENTLELVLQRNDGHRVAIRCLAASKKGAGRGKSMVGAVLDEAAMFRDAETGVVNDDEVFRAVSPRVLNGGQVIIASTPWAEVGLLHSLWKANHGKPETALVAHAPTLVLRDDEHTREYVAREEKRDPANARREFGAEFMAGDAAAFFDPRAVKEATVDDLPLPAEPPTPPDTTSADYDEDAPPEAVYAFGADFGFRRDSSALVGVRRDAADVYTVIAIEEQVPTERPLVPSVTVSGFAKTAKAYGAETLCADGHYRETVVEHCDEHGIGLVDAPAGANGNAETHVLVRSLFHEGRIRLPNHERLLRQIREVTSRPLAGGGLSIESPRWKTGGHGDIERALVLAVWHASRQPKPEAYTPPLAPGSYEWHRADVAARKEKLIERARRRKDPDDDDWILGE